MPGWDPDSEYLAVAGERDAVEPAPDLAAAVAGAELVVVAAPVGELPRTVREVLDRAPEGCTVTDVGSTKGPVCAAAGDDPRFVGGHPICGAETRGPGPRERGALRRRDLVPDPDRGDRARAAATRARVRHRARRATRRDRARCPRPPGGRDEPPAARARERPPQPGRLDADRRSRPAAGGGRLAPRHDEDRRRQPPDLGRHLPRQPRGARGGARRAAAPDRAGGAGARRRRRGLPRPVDRRGERAPPEDAGDGVLATRAISSGCGSTSPTGPACSPGSSRRSAPSGSTSRTSSSTTCRPSAAAR